MSNSMASGTAEKPLRSNKLRQWIVLIVIVLTTISILLLAAEYAIRWRQAVRHGTTKTADEMYEFNQATGLRLPIANMQSGPIKTESHGFRNPEIGPEKPPGTIRLAFLGASTTWCGEVSSNAHTWPHRVVEKLRQLHPTHHFDYINAGVPGYTLSSSLKRYETQIASFAPDIVVIYHATNDMSANLREIAVAQGLLESTQFARGSWLAKYSTLWNLVEKNFQILLSQRSASIGKNRLRIAGKDITGDFSFALEQVVRRVQQDSAVVALPTFASHLRVNQTAERQLKAAASSLYYMPFMTPNSLLASYEAYNNEIIATANKTGALPISGHEEIPADSQHFTDSVHFSDAGAERMADRVATALRKNPAFNDLVKQRQQLSISDSNTATLPPSD